ncbi:hypothetical protein BH09PAT3_BH09PAT3_0120 [soil metagenome]
MVGLVGVQVDAGLVVELAATVRRRCAVVVGRRRGRRVVGDPRAEDPLGEHDDGCDSQDDEDEPAHLQEVERVVVAEHQHTAEADDGDGGCTELGGDLVAPDGAHGHDDQADVDEHGGGTHVRVRLEVQDGLHEDDREDEDGHCPQVVMSFLGHGVASNFLGWGRFHYTVLVAVVVFSFEENDCTRTMDVRAQSLSSCR